MGYVKRNRYCWAVIFSLWMVRKDNKSRIRLLHVTKVDKYGDERLFVLNHTLSVAA